MRQHIYVDYFDDIYVYDEKKRKRRLQQAARPLDFTQFHALVKNIRYLPCQPSSTAITTGSTRLFSGCSFPASSCLPSFMHHEHRPALHLFHLAIKWWIVGRILAFAFAFATPDYLVDKNWDKDFITLPIVTAESKSLVKHIK